MKTKTRFSKKQRRGKALRRGVWVALNMKSSNRKTGPIPVTVSDERTCPPRCIHYGTSCYAQGGPSGLHWAQVGRSRGDNWTAFCRRLRRFPVGQLWRHDVAGDLPMRVDGLIHAGKLRQLTAAAKHTRGFTYTHHDPRNSHNARAIAKANAGTGLTVNLSADTLTEADEYAALDIGPVVVTIPADARPRRTPAGRIITICPAQTRENVTCEICQLCQRKERTSIVAFLAHGIGEKKLSRRLQTLEQAGAIK